MSSLLKRKNIGISMEDLESSITIDASDIVSMIDDISKIIKEIDISKYTNFIIKRNLIFTISIKILILLLSIFGYATSSHNYLAVFADTEVTLLTILNTLRIKKNSI